MKADVAKLVKAKRDEAELARKVIHKEEALNEETETLLAKVTLARSIADVELAGLTYSKEQNELRCSVCVCSETMLLLLGYFHTISQMGYHFQRMQQIFLRNSET